MLKKKGGFNNNLALEVTGLGSWKNHGPWKLEKSRGWIEDDASNSYGRLFLPNHPQPVVCLVPFGDPKVFVVRCPWAQAAAPSSALSLPKRNLGKGRISGDLFYIDQYQKICICIDIYRFTHTYIYICIYVYIYMPDVPLFDQF